MLVRECLVVYFGFIKFVKCLIKLGVKFDVMELIVLYGSDYGFEFCIVFFWSLLFWLLGSCLIELGVILVLIEVKGRLMCFNIFFWVCG